MFGLIRTLVANFLGEPKSRTEGCRGRLASAALLTHVATVANEMSERRREKLFAVLKHNFGLDDLTTVQLMEDAAAANRKAVDLYGFTRPLNEVLDDKGRRQAVRMMWEIVYADGSANEFESNVIWRAADLLGVSSRQRVELRRQIVAANAAPAHG